MKGLFYLSIAQQGVCPSLVCAPATFISEGFKTRKEANEAYDKEYARTKDERLCVVRRDLTETY
jgi:hypothetical protein